MELFSKKNPVFKEEIVATTEPGVSNTPLGQLSIHGTRASQGNGRRARQRLEKERGGGGVREERVSWREDGRAEMVSGRRALVCGGRLKTEGILQGREMRGILQGLKAFLSEGDRLQAIMIRKFTGGCFYLTKTLRWLKWSGED